MKGKGLGLGMLASVAAIALVPPAASGNDGVAPFAVDCDPFAPSTSVPAAARVPEASAGAVEPNVEEAYDQALEDGLAPATRRARASGPVRVPVYVHVVQAAAGPSVVPASQITDQMTVLNNSFNGTSGGDDAGIFFELIDTDVTANPAWVNLEPETAAEVAMKTALHEGGARSLNLYLLDLGTFLGWATFPFEYAGAPLMDGVVVEKDSVPGGSAAPYNLGDTAPHEVGHWLGLFHTFQGGCGPPGDFVDDTEPEATEHFGCPTINSCPGGGNDPVDNFMSYSDDACMFRFTPGQGNRMHDLTAQFRNGAPAASNQALSADAGQAVAVNVQATDPDGDAVSYAVTDPPDHGTLSGTPPALTYTSNAGYDGPDSFAVQASDVFGAIGTAAVAVDVQGGELSLNAKVKQKLRKLSVTGSCGSVACDLTATGKIVANRSGNRAVRASKSFKLKQASGSANANGSAKLKLKLSKSKQRRLLRLLKDGWKAKAKVKVTATRSSGATSKQKLSITITP